MKHLRFSVVSFVLTLVILLYPAGRESAVADQTITQKGETAVLDPANWNKVFAGKQYFDAIRPMLVRFPGIAKSAASKIKNGYSIKKIQLNLKWKKQEGAKPQRGRRGWGAEGAYKKNPGRWHAVVYPLLKPWQSGKKELGPTADAYINELGYWTKGGARGDGTDRVPKQFGPAPLHAKHKTAQINLTPMIQMEEYGKDMGARLRHLEQRGVQVLKKEAYDLKYAGQDGWWFGSYGWRTSTGYMRIWVEQPVLKITFEKEGGTGTFSLPEKKTVSEQASELRNNPDGTASMSVPENWQERIREHTTKPEDMPRWQWKRVQELHKLGGWNLGRFNASGLLSGNKKEYYNTFKGMKGGLAMPPRYWMGHLTSDFALVPNAFPDLLPDLYKQHLKHYWRAWLHPETEYVEKPRKRGYFRHYTWSLGTQNFNFNATASTYLAGQFLGSKNALRDARHGLENLLLRGYSFYNGANQEVGDTYYQALSNAAGRMVAKYAEDDFDQLMARITSERLTEQLVSMYNPNTRRMTHPMGRGEMKYQASYQDGPYFAVHTLSKSGALTNLQAGYKKKNPHHVKRFDVPVFGKEGPPARFALLAPWGEKHWSNVVDGKDLPWHVIARDRNFKPDEGPSWWHVNYLTENYSIGSRSENGTSVTHLTAQWRRRTDQVKKMKELSTLQMMFGTNGRLYQSMGAWGMNHHKNKVLAFKKLPKKGSLKAPPNPNYAGGWREKEGDRGGDQFNAIHSSISVIAFEKTANREVWVNDKKVKQLSGRPNQLPDNPTKYKWVRNLQTSGKNSVFAKQNDVITVKDGTTYVGIIPLAINPIKQNKEVEIAFEWPVLYVHSFLYRSDQPLNINELYNRKKQSSAGFYLEMGNREEYSSFSEFRNHMMSVKVQNEWNAQKQQADLKVDSGDDTIEMGFRPGKYDSNSRFAQTPVYRRVNGENPFLKKGVIRESPWSILGRTGKLTKNGAVLKSETGYRTYMLAEPESGIVTAYNPVPDPKFMKLTLPDGQTIEADGRLGLARIEVHPETNEVRIRHELTTKQKERTDMAEHIVLHGFSGEPNVVLNDQEANTVSFTINGTSAYAVALEHRKGEPAGSQKLKTNLRSSRKTWDRVENSNVHETWFRDWYVVGPFPIGSYAHHYFPLKQPVSISSFDKRAEFQGGHKGKENQQTVTWQPAISDEENRIGSEPVWLKDTIDPGNGVIAYAAAKIVSDQKRRVQLIASSDERLGLWLNGEKVLFKKGYRMNYKGQDRKFITLEEGENLIIAKLSHGFESWRFYFRLADEQGLPIEEGIRFKGPHGMTPADGE